MSSVGPCIELQLFPSGQGPFSAESPVSPRFGIEEG